MKVLSSLHSKQVAKPKLELRYSKTGNKVQKRGSVTNKVKNLSLEEEMRSRAQTEKLAFNLRMGISYI